MINLASHQEMKQEAVRRLKLLGIPEENIREFIETGKIPNTDDTFRCNIGDLPEGMPIKDVDKFLHILTYLAINNSAFGVSITAFASVSGDRNKWPKERRALREFVNLTKYSILEEEENEK